MEKKYECVEDLQGAGQYEGEVHTIEGWRQRSLEWIKEDAFDDYELIIEELKNLPKEKVMNWVSYFWDLEFKEVA